MHEKIRSIKSRSHYPPSHRSWYRSVDWRMIGLLVLTAVALGLWRWLRIAYDAGDHHAIVAATLVVPTIWLGWQLLRILIDRLKDYPER